MKKAIFMILIVFCLYCSSAFAINYSNMNFSNFKVKQFTPENVKKSYYDSFDIYYKSYDYQQRDFCDSSGSDVKGARIRNECEARSFERRSEAEPRRNER